jgi:hypothetical protein
MNSISKMMASAAFAVDEAKARETARRQLPISLAIALAALGAVAAVNLHTSAPPEHREGPVRTAQWETKESHPIKAKVRYVDRAPAGHDVFLASQ